MVFSTKVATGFSLRLTNMLGGCALEEPTSLRRIPIPTVRALLDAVIAAGGTEAS